MKNPIYRKLAPTPPAQVNRVPSGRSQSVDLRKILHTRSPAITDANGEKHEAAALIKGMHRTGGRPLESVVRLQAEPGLRKIEAAPAPAPAARLPTHDDGSPLTEEVRDRLDREHVVDAIGAALRGPRVPLTPGWGRR